MTKHYWNKEYLDKLSKKDNAILLDDYTSYTRKTTYNFKCSCGENSSKTGRRIETNGAFCKKCTQKTGDIKGNNTRISKLNDEQKKSLSISNETKKKKDEYEADLCEWRNNLVINVIPELNKWYTHPIHTNYEATSNGDIRNKTTKALIEGSRNDDGRTTISINNHKKQKHRFMMECVYAVEIPLDYDIDHIDQNAGNNNFENLKILTRKEHCMKTATTNPERGKKATIKSSKRIICQEFNKEGECIEERAFNSINDASKKMNITKRPIQNSIRTNKLTTHGYLFSEETHDDRDIEGEKWLEYNDSNLYVSNMGRVWFKYLSVPYKTYGSKSIDGYYTVSHKKHSVKVHNLVASLFIGEKPTTEHTIDHIDNNRGNNIVENLRWATKLEQALNRTTVKAIEVYNYLTGEIIDTFESSKDCCEKYKVHPSIVSNALGFGIEHFMRGRQLGNHKYLSVRHQDLSNENKLKREIDILTHEIDILRKDKNKRKSNDENLPVHITKTKSSYVLTITFRGTKYRKCSDNINNLILEKETWINERKQYYINMYRSISNLPSNVK